MSELTLGPPVLERFVWYDEQTRCWRWEVTLSYGSDAISLQYDAVTVGVEEEMPTCQVEAEGAASAALLTHRRDLLASLLTPEMREALEDGASAIDRQFGKGSAQAVTLRRLAAPAREEQEEESYNRTPDPQARGHHPEMGQAAGGGRTSMYPEGD